MSLNTTFLHPRPQREIASLIRARLAACKTAQIVWGFATPDGVDALRANVGGRLAAPNRPDVNLRLRRKGSYCILQNKIQNGAN